MRPAAGADVGALDIGTSTFADLIRQVFAVSLYPIATMSGDGQSVGASGGSLGGELVEKRAHPL
jgi:hypothetical protein